jgi:peptidoglycan/xylan/chitin deacetylase (PgdA/CDA1 family)
MAAEGPRSAALRGARNYQKRNDLIRAWGTAGHQIGNHTATHPNFEDVSLAEYEREFQLCDNAIRDMPGFTRRFRFPYLKEGNTIEKRDGFRAFLDSNAYKPGPVSVDASDWYYSQRLSARLKINPDANPLPIRDAYLSHLYYRALRQPLAHGAWPIRGTRPAAAPQLDQRIIPKERHSDVQGQRLDNHRFRNRLSRPGLHDASQHSPRRREHSLGTRQAKGSSRSSLSRRR